MKGFSMSPMSELRFSKLVCYVLVYFKLVHHVLVYSKYQYIMYHTYLIYWYDKYHPSFGTRILRTIIGIRLGYYVLSHNT